MANPLPAMSCSALQVWDAEHSHEEEGKSGGTFGVPHTILGTCLQEGMAELGRCSRVTRKGVQGKAVAFFGGAGRGEERYPQSSAEPRWTPSLVCLPEKF